MIVAPIARHRRLHRHAAPRPSRLSRRGRPADGEQSARPHPRRRPHGSGVLEPRPLVHQDARGHPVRADRLRPRRVTHARSARVHPARATAEGLHREHAVHLREPPGLPLHVRQFRPEQEARAARPARRPRVHHGGDPVGLQQPGQLQGRRGHRHRQDDRHGHREGDGVPGAVGHDVLGQEREPAGLHVQRQHPADLDVHPDRAQPARSASSGFAVDARSWPASRSRPRRAAAS